MSRKQLLNKVDTRIYRPAFATQCPIQFADAAKSASYHTYMRFARIPPFVTNERVAVYNGKKFLSFIVKPWMHGHKFGEFILTKKLGSTIHQTKRNKKKK